MKVKEIKTVVVLGMHRSGTSMTTGIISKLGIDVGKIFAPRSFANPIGYFEDRDFYELNKKILKEAGGNWRLPPDREMILAQSDKFKNQICDLVRKKESQLWGWKDPRTNLTIELYLSFLTNPYFIVCRREPMAVAKSLKQRQNMKVEDSIKLTKSYEERINNFFQEFTNLPRLNLNYEDVTGDSEKEIDKIIEFLGIQVSNKQYHEALKIVLTPIDIQKLRNKINWKTKAYNRLLWGDE